MAQQSLQEVHSSVVTDNKKNTFRKLLSFMGPAFVISVGYMDPGNWATDLEGGSHFGYQLLWVLLMSNLMALLLQMLSARLGVVKQRDLAQASRESYPPFVNTILYIFAEIAIAACDLAEVIGMAIGLHLLFGIPMLYGVCLTIFDTFLLLFLMNRGIKKMEAFIIGLIAIIGGAFILEMIFSHPQIGALSRGFIPKIVDTDALYIAIGIIGATVMPHNLYLHSSLVQTRQIESTPKSIRQALKFNFIDSAIALNLAFFVNAALLILAAAAFHSRGYFQVTEIQDAYQLLSPLLGTKWASVLFAVALIAAGQSSTITGTIAGQIIMEGHLHVKMKPWIRRLITRALAIVPAFGCIVYFGENSTGKLLILSQVVLSLQLGFAIIPLIHFVSDKYKMGEFVIGPWLKIGAWFIAAIIIALNIKLVIAELIKWINQMHPAILSEFFAIGVAASAGVLLLYLIVHPLLRIRQKA
ncbi:hypothetical protein PEPS_33130 (plasmid) [Persicobacter psychrovividus]|uniref:Divalent metal cation transporter MntH n=1 Tax=Persicobacter psychrovividus TaxID=387638 RepID=A0ABM7VJ67_9BACT|nr:hypothetical protein PEPS_33130 [Persicobacter psychrovividus]